jgi:signal transduction histidine kinase
MARNRFFWRAGCFLGLVFILITIFIVSAILLGAELLGVVQISRPFYWVIPLSLLILVLGFGFLVLAGRGLRHLSAPFGDLVEAAERIAEGDYTARITERGPREVRTVARSFNAMASRLQVSDEQRRALLADVTHEFRTPLTVIQGNIEGMLDGVYAVGEGRLKSILEETQILSRLVGDLRTLALAESGALQLIKEPTDLALLIGETMASFNTQADAQGVTLSTDTHADAPTLNLDPQRMHEVLANLIANALRYTPRGGTIQVSLRANPEGGKSGAVIEIQDSGSGIPPEDLAHVFDRFYKARDSGGMGLGLVIAKRLVELHGGTIQAESEVGKGTMVRINLPGEEI